MVTERFPAYIESEAAIIGGIRRGLADVEAGRVVAHDKAMAEIEDVIDLAERRAGPNADAPNG